MRRRPPPDPMLGYSKAVMWAAIAVAISQVTSVIVTVLRIMTSPE